MANRLAAKIMFHTQPCPPIFLNKLADTKPQIPDVKAYSSTAVEFRLLCLQGGEGGSDEGREELPTRRPTHELPSTCAH